MAVYQQAIALQSTPDCNVVQFHRRGMFRAVSAARPQMNIEKKKKIFNHQRILNLKMQEALTADPPNRAIMSWAALSITTYP